MSSAPQYSEQEQQQLSRQLTALNDAIQIRQLDNRPATVELLCEMHRVIFQGVCSHAGQCRGPGRLSEHVCFGPHRSVHRNAVDSELRSALQRAENQIRELIPVGRAKERTFAVLDVGIATHAQIIRIHPFEDGNGRTARAFCDYMFVRGGIPPIPMEHTKQTYLARLNEYFVTGMKNIAPLRDLYLSSVSLAPAVNRT